ncbi:hypothetical protein PYW08_013407 [Mythimna loreyi]|uniref:Uncharacterized protein n=1 Tax=Mythimna loreyi TaxID=667449 RepID=A0ACC2QFX9_9NEOP|nr:hypothetical protein PYW08_013407 [Mythimna loreyi]
MSFLTSLGQYVAGMADSVAGLALSPRRVPPSRHRSAEESQAHPPPPSTATMRGFPRVVPTEGASALSARRRTLDCLAPAPPPRRGGSLRVPRNQQPPEKPTMAFCKRRLSWPEVDNSVNSGVQDTDGSYFENFTALSWRHENRRLAALRLVEARSERAPPAPHDLGLPSVSAQLSHKEHEHLYTEVLYCIENAVGAPAPDGQFAAYKEEVVEHARRAFRVSPEVHARAMRAAGSERPPTVVLGCSVIEADGLEAKDANGFSDPYCMLGIQPASLPASPRASEDEGRKHGFRLSFKRRDGRQQRDSLGRLPARYIRATSVRQHTLSPKWNETFKFDIDDISSDVLHLDIWDHDDESSVLDAVSRLNEVRGVRGLGRFFKQVCQSARQGSQDDFLGCVNIPLREIPSTGVEAWYKLEARSQRSSVQGRIRLRLWLSAREAGRHDDDNWQQVRQHERLFGVLLAHEVELQRAAAAATAAAAAAAAAAGQPEPSAATPTPPWDGDLCGAAQTLLHQHAIQGDLSALQASIARFAAACRLNADAPLDPKYMHKLLIELERAWCACEAISGGGSGDSGSGASRDEERWLADCFGEYVDRALHQLRLHRDLYPVLHQYSINKLEYLLRCLSQLSQMKAFWRCCPFNKEIRSEIVSALRKGTSEWYEGLCGQDTHSERGEDLVNLITLVQIDLQQGLTYYHPLFETTNNVPYFSIVFNQIDKMLSEDVRQCVEHWVVEGWCGVVEEPMYDEHGNAVCLVTIAKTLPFEVLSAVRELCAAAALAPQPQAHPHAPHDPPPQLLDAYLWFEPLIDRWLAVTKTMALQRVRAAVELDRPVEGEHLVKHSTSSVDTAACLYHMRLVWRSVGGAEECTAGGSVRLLEAACATALHYADLVHGALADQGYYENYGQNKTTEEICTIVNNLEYVRRSLAEYDDEHIVNDENARQLVRGALGTLDARAARAAAPLAARARPPLRKAVFHLAWSPDTLPTTQAITPLLEFLDQHLSSLNTWLLPRAFIRALAGCWSGVLKEVSSQADAGGAERPRVYHHRLREALDLLAEFFHAEGKGLPMSEVHNAEWFRVEQRMEYHQAPTEKLLELWLADRLAEQARTPLPSRYGSILVRVYFNHDSLCVEVLSARDVIPLDPNGLSDPFVVLELVPKRLFPKAHEQTTNVQKKTLNPVWDECFEFAVSLEACRWAGAALALSVWDRDVLTADDFAGEAFVSLARVPGVNCHAPPDPLRPLELPLMQLHDRNHPIIQILESRTTDKLAIDFVKKQKLRFAEQ